MKAFSVVLLLLLLFAGASLTSAQTPQVALSLTVSSLNTGASQSLPFGLDPSATDGLDTGLGEQLAPPLPPEDGFAAHFLGSEIGIAMDWQRQDFRQGGSATNGVRVHEIQYQAETGDQVTFSWALPLGVTGRLQDVVTGALRDLPMTGTGSYTETNLAFNKFKVTLTYALTPLQVPVKVLLEGPYNTSQGKMNLGLNTGGHLATRFPAVDIPAEAVDSVTIEIRDSFSAATSTVRKFAPAWLLSDGSLKAFTDTMKAYVEYPSVPEGTFFVVVRHRTHLAIMTAAPVALSPGTAQYDFTTGQEKAYGSNAMKALSGGTKYAMYAGDVNGNGQVKYNLSGNDRALILTRIGGSNINATVTGYYNEDVNLDGVVKYNLSGNDRAILLLNIGGSNINATVSTQVPN